MGAMKGTPTRGIAHCQLGRIACAAMDGGPPLVWEGGFDTVHEFSILGGMRPIPVANPTNPWSTTEVEYLGEPPTVRLQVFEDHTKEILSTNDSPDVGFRYSINPYRGCQHAC